MPVTATDDYSGRSVGLDSPPRKWFAVTPSDTDELSHICRVLWVGVGGDLEVIGADDTVAVVLKNVPSGSAVAGMFRQVKSGSTTATNIKAGY